MYTSGTKNKSSKIFYSHVPSTILTLCHDILTWAFLDTDAMTNFMDRRLSAYIDPLFGKEWSVTLEDGSNFLTFELLSFVNVQVDCLIFSPSFLAVENFSFPVVLGFPW